MHFYKKLIAIPVCAGVLALNLAGCGGKKKSKNPVAPVSETAAVEDGEFSSWSDNAKIRAAIEAHDYATAKQLATARISDSPKDARAHYLLGQALKGEKKYEQARKSLETATELAPEDKNYKKALYQCLSLMLDAALANDMASEAIGLGKELLQAGYEPAKSESRLAKAYDLTAASLIATANLVEAESLLREAMNLLPEQPEPRLRLARLLMQADRLMESERILSSLTVANGDYVPALIAYAALLQRMGEVRKANEILNRALELDPQNSEANELRSTFARDVPLTITNESTTSLETMQNRLNTLEQTGNLSEQKKLLENLVTLYPNESESLLKLSKVCEKLGMIEDAFKYSELYLAGNPVSMSGRLQMARCLYQLGQNDRAMSLIEELEPTYPDRLEIMAEKGQVLARSGNFDEARKVWQQVLSEDADHVATLFNYAQLEMESGKHQEAQEYFEKAIRKEPFNHKYRYFAGINLIQSGLKEQAHALWASARSSLNSEDPYSARILRALGEDKIANAGNSGLLAPPPVIGEPAAASTTPAPQVYVPSGIIEESAVDNDYEHALEFARAGMFNEAIMYFRQVIRKNPNHFNALMNLGKVYTASGKHEVACANYLKALKIDPRNIYALRALANGYSEIGMHSLAAEITEQVRLSNPDQLVNFPKYAQRNPRNNPRAYEPLAGAMLDEGLSAEALAVVNTGIAQQNDNNSLYLLQGDVYKSQGQYETALDAYKTALTREPQSPQPYIRMGDLFITAGQLTSAADEYHKALKAGFIDPDSMFVIADRFRQIGREIDSKRVLGQLKGMNLNQDQLKKLDERLGTNLASQPEENIQ